MKYITILSVLFTLASAMDVNFPSIEIYEIKEDQIDDSKFLGKLGGHFTMMSSLTD